MKMRDKLLQLRQKNIFIGTSSWKYLGWKNLVFHRNYRSEKAFKDTCLEEYSELFTTVGVDHTYYAWPTLAQMQHYAEQTPESFRFGLKVTERITVFKYPNIKRYGKDAGQRNAHFLDADLFRESFLPPLQPIKNKLGPLVFEFSQFFPGTLHSGSEFVSRLDQFFSQLRDLNDYQFAIEIRNANWLKPTYFDLLQKYQIAPVFNSWTRMPELSQQFELASTHQFPALVARLLLQPGTRYEEAVEAFSPYDRIQEEHPSLRKAGAQLIQKAISSGKPAYLFVNNRAEGCAPKTIEGIVNLVESFF